MSFYSFVVYLTLNLQKAPTFWSFFVVVYFCLRLLNYIVFIVSLNVFVGRKWLSSHVWIWQYLYYHPKLQIRTKQKDRASLWDHKLRLVKMCRKGSNIQLILSLEFRFKTFSVFIAAFFFLNCVSGNNFNVP